MVIKKIIVKNMNEAITRIRYELGKDAIIISQRKIRESGIKGYFKPKLIEVTAALENNTMEKQRKAINKQNEINKENEINNFESSLINIKQIIEKEENKKIQCEESNKVESKENNKLELKEDSKAEAEEKIAEEVKEIKSLLNQVIKNTNKENEENLVENYLQEIDVDIECLEDIDIESYKEVDEFKDVFKKLLHNDIKISDKQLSGKVVLIGPTGVGKTTTIAKLAGRLALMEGKKVGLITIDTYRIGAVDQLKTYAEIMNIPFKVVMTLKEVEESLNELKDCDVILIDTTGRSSKNTMQLSELRAFVQKINADSSCLVISGTTKNKDIDTILKGYGQIKYDNVIITKLDETASYGCIYNIIKKSKKEIAYIATGQNVPDDIKIPSKEEICKLILGEESIC